MIKYDDKIKISLVDDHQIVRDGIKTLLLSNQNIQVVGEADDGASALSMLINKLPDILIVDISLPDFSGIELTKIVSKEYPGVKVLILSMYTDEDFVLNAIKAGACGYLPKNTSKDILLESVKRIFNGENYFDPRISRTLISGLVKKAREESFLPGEILSKREIEILSMCVKGFSNKEIADHFFISIRTVESHKNHIMQKLEIKTTVDLLKYAIKFKLDEPPIK